MGKVLPVHIQPHPVLQRVADPAELNDRTRKLAEDMVATIRAADGVGLAAPQVGQSTRLIVVDTGVEQPDGRRAFGVTPPEVLVNPEILSLGSETLTRQEGCLSLPGLWADVERATQVTVRYQTLDGEAKEETVTGLRAIVFQHEIDHLNGILFTDRLTAARKALALPKWHKLRGALLKHGGEFDLISAERGLIAANPKLHQR